MKLLIPLPTVVNLPYRQPLCHRQLRHSVQVVHEIFLLSSKALKVFNNYLGSTVFLGLLSWPHFAIGSALHTCLRHRAPGASSEVRSCLKLSAYSIPQVVLSTDCWTLVSVSPVCVSCTCTEVGGTYCWGCGAGSCRMSYLMVFC